MSEADQLGMGIDARWLLPDGIDELLPPAARRLETLRRALLTLYDSWGYEQVIPPFIEFLESLLTGTGNDLDLQTFKLTDQLSGRLLGIRADMTPQVARIDAHMQRVAPTRFCYLGTVLRTRSDDFAGSRSPIQVGAELYGHSGCESDLEVLLLMLQTLKIAGLKDIHLDLGHVAVFRSLAQQAALNPEQEEWLFEALQRKAVPDIQEQLHCYPMSPALRQMLLALAELNGSTEVLDVASQALSEAPPGVHQALTTLRKIAYAVQQQLPDLPIHCDLAELRGYRYHTGVVFAAYVPSYGQAVAKGGRYDDIARVFGHSRPATGFSADLRTLLNLGMVNESAPPAVYAPWFDDAALEQCITTLRQDGTRVIRALPGEESNPTAMGCDRVLIKRDGTWQVELIDAAG